MLTFVAGVGFQMVSWALLRKKKTAKCMFTFLVELGFEMGPWAFKKKRQNTCYFFGGVRVPDSTAFSTEVKKQNDKMHPHVCGGGRVSDGVVSPFAKKKKNDKVYTC